MILQDIILNQKDNLSVENLNKTAYISQVFPTPTSTQLDIRSYNPFDGEVTLSFKDSQGTTLFYIKPNESSVSVSNPENGLFMVMVSLIVNGTTYDIKRFIVNR